MRILILGVGDAFTRKHFGSSALIEAPQSHGHVLVDCPDLIHRTLHHATAPAGWNADASTINDIVLTHLHGDHCNGLESFGFYRRIMRMKNPAISIPRLHVTKPVADRLWERLGPAMDGAGGGGGVGSSRSSQLSDFYEVHILDPSRRASIAGLEVRCRFTQHPVPTIGLLLSDAGEWGRRGGGGGGTLGWSGDTPFEQAHVDWLNQADIIVHESNLGAAHTPIASLNKLPEALRRKIRLIHLPDDFDSSSTDMAQLQEGELLVIAASSAAGAKESPHA